jgi:hypothetical protein
MIRAAQSSPLFILLLVTRNQALLHGRLKWYAVNMLLVLASLAAGPVVAQVTINVTVSDTAGVTNPTTTNLTNAIVDNVKASINEWCKYIAITGPRSIEVVVRFKPMALRGSGRSLTTSLVRIENGTWIYEQGVAAELRTGIDPNGPDLYDVEIVFEPTYLRDTIWFDPNPNMRVAAVPANRLDSMSFFLHEFGHALGFNGWKDATTGNLPGTYQSTYDYFARFDGANWFFHGNETMGLWGAELPLSRVNNNGNYAFEYTHYGNPSGLGADRLLVDGLMNGVYFRNATRYYIGLLDIAIIRDIGIDGPPPGC